MKGEDLLHWDSKRIIGNVLRRFKQLERKGWDWSSFYNGWLEGRFAMLNELQAQQKEKYCGNLLWSECSDGGGEYSCNIGYKTSSEKCEENIGKCKGYSRRSGDINE